jgi:group I intron endonuclease
MTGIYLIRNKINGKTYIGQSLNIQRRFWDHRCVSHETNVHLRHSLKKYGKENFEYIVLEECSPEMLDDREIYYIEKYKPEYNVTKGGQGRKKRLPEEVKDVLRRKAKEQWERKSPQEKESIIRNNLTNIAQVGHPVSEETREKLRKANLGKRQSKETIEKRKDTFLRKRAAGYRQDNNGHRKKIVCLETGTVYESVKDAGEKLGINNTSISANLKGRQKSTHGYHFEYLKV